MREARLLLLVAGFLGAVALLALGSGDTGAAGGGKYNSMTQMKTVQPCTAQTDLEKVSDKDVPPDVGADPGETITYTITETNNAEGSCLLDTNSNGVMDTLRVTGTYVLENRSGAGALPNIHNACNPLDPRETCVLNVLDWVETHNPGEGNLWHALHVNGGAPTDTHSGNPLDGHNGLDWYCPTDSTGPMPDLDGNGQPGGGNTGATGKCAPSAQPAYGNLVVTKLDQPVSFPQSLVCGQPGGSCFGAPQTYNYELTVPITAEQAATLASADGIRNVVHFDMFNEELTSSGRNHFSRASFSSASLGSNAYHVTITDTPPQAPGDGDSCTANWPFTSCDATATGWEADGATLPGGASGTVEVQYKVRDDDCEKVITNVANATHTDVTGTKVSDEGPAAALTRVRNCPRLTVNKDLKPGSDPGLFNLLIDDNVEAADVGGGGTTGPKKMTIGTHTASETAGTGTDLADYATSTGGDCDSDGSIDLKAGDIKTCTITNKRKPTLTVNKELVPSNDPGKFNLQIDGATAGTGGDVGDGGTTGAVVVDWGAHTVGETAGTGTNMSDYFTPSVGGDCTDNNNGTGSITLDWGENKTCVITNTKVPTLTVVKILEPPSDTGTFRLKIDGGFVTACLGATSSAAIQVSIGDHTVSEVACGTTNPSDYTATIDGDCDTLGNVTVAAGGNKSCTITNTRKPTLTVNKVLSPSNDSGLFNLQIDGATAGTGGNVGNGGSTGAVVVDIGSHSVGETAGTGTDLNNYTTTIGGDCAVNDGITLAAGDVKTCTITNIRKVVVTTWNAHSQGFWKNKEGHESLDANGDSVLDSPPRPAGGVCLGIGYHGGTARGTCITTIGNSDTIMDGVSEADKKQAATCNLVVGTPGCTPLDSGLTRGKLTNLFAHALALEYNIIWLNGGFTTAKISDIGESACTTPAMITDLTTLGLTTGSTVGAVRAKANQLINDSTTAVPAVVTDALVTAMSNVLSQCVNANHAVVPGDRDWDGVPEDVDTCPGINNPDQSDVDGDGIGDDCDADMDNDSRGVTVGGQPVFRGSAEAYMGTDERRDCGLDAWGPDFDGSGEVDVFDVGDLKATFASRSGDGVYTNRDDLSTDGYINVVDLTIMKRFIGQTCAGVDPIQPGAP